MESDASRQEKGPSKKSRQEASPSKKSRQEASPSKKSRQEASPSKESRQEASPSKESRQEASPSKKSRQEKGPSKESRAGTWWQWHRRRRTSCQELKEDRELREKPILKAGFINLEEAKRHQEFFTGKLSDNTRQLSFAGLGAVWVFGGGPSHGLSSFHYSTTFLWAVLLLVFALSSDFLQYVAGSIAWSGYRRKKENDVIKKSMSDSFLAPRAINWATIFFFWLKAAFVIAGYSFLAVSVYHRIR
ncbi:MAG: hypothetical protein ABSE82_12960 [Nitrososphaerales archaeon]|jgi:hypothetical protein